MDFVNLLRPGQSFALTTFGGGDEVHRVPCSNKRWGKGDCLIFGRFLGLGHPRGPGVNLGRILGVPSIQPFGGGGPAMGLYQPPPRAIESPIAPEGELWPTHLFDSEVHVFPGWRHSMLTYCPHSEAEMTVAGTPSPFHFIRRR